MHSRTLTLLVLAALFAAGCAGLRTPPPVTEPTVPDSWQELRGEGSPAQGMTAEELDEAFGDFYTTKSGGTGLGLSIAYRIIQAHNGSIEARPRHTNGTSMVVTLPADTPPQTSAAQQSQESVIRAMPELPGPGGKLSVLVLDEGNSARQILGETDAPVRSVVVGIVDEVT